MVAEMGMAEPPDYSQRLCFVVLAYFQGSNSIRKVSLKLAEAKINVVIGIARMEKLKLWVIW